MRLQVAITSHLFQRLTLWRTRAVGMQEVFAGCGHHDNRHHFTQGRHLKRMCVAKDTHGMIIMRLPMSLIVNVQSLACRGTLEVEQ